MCRRKNYENRSIISKVMDKSIVSPFFDSRCSSSVVVNMNYLAIFELELICGLSGK